MFNIFKDLLFIYDAQKINHVFAFKSFKIENIKDFMVFLMLLLAIEQKLLFIFVIEKKILLNDFLL